MIEPREFFEALTERGIDFYAGVPDSLLSNLCTYLEDNFESDRHLITANEGNAIGLAIGYHISSGKFAAVYMQNSGLGNIVNPCISLADSEIYKVPMLLIIGWRGEPGVEDEPQHIKQGRLTIPLLNLMEIPHWVIDANSNISSILNLAFANMVKRKSPVALVVRKDTFSKTKIKTNTNKPITNKIELSRESALDQILKLCSSDDLIISTTGKTSRELFELRLKNGQKQTDFLTVGGMGHTSSIALGVAIGQPQRRVICLDGDGSLIMHMGSLPVIANFGPKNLIHVLLNNLAHDSVGGQPTSANVIDFEKLANAVGYKAYARSEDIDTLVSSWRKLININGPVLLEVRIKNGSRASLGRPTSTPEQNKIAFMERLSLIKNGEY